MLACYKAAPKVVVQNVFFACRNVLLWLNGLQEKLHLNSGARM